MPNFASFRVIARLLGVVYGAVQGSSKISPFFPSRNPNFLENCIIAPGKLDAAILQILQGTQKRASYGALACRLK